MTRREFIGAATSVTALTILPRHVLGGPGNPAPSEKLNLACIGVGGRGRALLEKFGFASENIVALCDVDEKYAAPVFQRFPGARRYRDFRRMLEREGKNIDAVMGALEKYMTFYS